MDDEIQTLSHEKKLDGRAETDAVDSEAGKNAHRPLADDAEDFNEDFNIVDDDFGFDIPGGC